MKKVSFLAASAFVVLMASCTGGSKGNLKTDVDSLSYAIGMANTQGLKEYLVSQKMDTTHMNDFVKGLKEGVKELGKKEEAYMLGLQIGQQVKNQMISGLNRQLFGNDSTQTVNVKVFMDAFIAATTGKPCDMTMEEAQGFVQQNMDRIRENSMQKLYAANREAGEKFLAENKKKAGVKTTPSGLQYKVITEGKGEIPTATSRVKVAYKGTLIDGTTFDQSPEGNPITFAANQVIKGWTEALTMMPVGSKWNLYIPQDLAYGAREAGQIKPFSTLIFEVELVGIENAPAENAPQIMPVR